MKLITFKGKIFTPVNHRSLARRAVKCFPTNPMRRKWMDAVAWMRCRPGGSIWILDREAPSPNWRLMPENTSLANMPATEIYR